MTLKNTVNTKTLIDYKSWNQVLCEYFFGKHNENKIVYLYVNENLIIKLGAKLKLNKEEAMYSFCKSIQSYGRNDPELVFEKAYIWGRKWFKQGKVGFPPFVGVLAITVLAATKMKSNRKKGIGAGNYYHRLRYLLELNGEGKPFYFEKTKYLWQHLITWQKENNGMYGYTNVFKYGQAYIGYPKSQCLVRDADREQIYDFFYWAGLRPGLNVNTNSMLEQLELYLSTKVNRLSNLFFKNKKGIREGIIQAVLFEYKNWTGSKDNQFEANTIDPQIKSLVKRYNMFLRIDEDRQTNFFNPKVKMGFFSIIDEDNISEEILETEDLKGFCYKNNTFYKEVNIQQNNLVTRHTYTILNQLKLVFEGGNLFFFRRGVDLGINGWINRDNIVKGKDHLVVFNTEMESVIKEWLVINEFKSKDIIISNLPSSWKCIFLKIHNREIIGSEDVLNSFVLKNDQDKITFLGGLKVGYMEWLLDGPPEVSIITKPKTTISVNDTPFFSLIDGEDTINFKNLLLKKSQIYKISFNDIEKTILLKNNHENLITFSGFNPKQYSNEKLKIAGTYIYESLESFPRPFKQKGFIAYLNTSNKEKSVAKKVPNFINAMPFNLNREYKDMGISFVNENLTHFRPIDLFFEYLTIRKEGNWDAFLKGIKWCFGSENIGLTAYKVRQKLSQLGFVEFVKDKDFNRHYWNVIPTSVAVIPSNDPIVYLTGGRTRESVRQLLKLTYGEVTHLQSIPNSSHEPLSIFLLGKSVDELKKFLNNLNIKYNWGLDYFSYDLLRCLPELSSYIKGAEPISEPIIGNSYWIVKGWDLFSHKWIKDKESPLKLLINSFGQYICLYRATSKNTIKIDRDIGKLYYARQQGIPIFNYKNYELKVKQAYELPELYERVLTSCIGQCPEVSNGYRVYRNVPHEIAISLVYKLGFQLNYYH
ncbi:hypothetical protein [Pseudalkalibacillus sp. SCS-8]|uniref:hypothetical protein n=1 Tax=Pseudalkalibacillus nanhaiensis TaxID=3115291 RepID=UPI0032DA86B1